MAAQAPRSSTTSSGRQPIWPGLGEKTDLPLQRHRQHRAHPGFRVRLGRPDHRRGLHLQGDEAGDRECERQHLPLRQRPQRHRPVLVRDHPRLRGLRVGRDHGRLLGATRPSLERRAPTSSGATTPRRRSPNQAGTDTIYAGAGNTTITTGAGSSYINLTAQNSLGSSSVTSGGTDVIIGGHGFIEASLSGGQMQTQSDRRT